MYYVYPLVCKFLVLSMRQIIIQLRILTTYTSQEICNSTKHLDTNYTAVIIVSNPDPSPKRKGGLSEYSTSSQHELWIPLKAKPLKSLAGLQ